MEPVYSVWDSARLPCRLLVLQPKGNLMSYERKRERERDRQKERRVDRQEKDTWNLSTLFGILLGYIVFYWFSSLDVYVICLYRVRKIERDI